MTEFEPILSISVYQQGRKKTLLKMFIVLIAYLILFILFLGLGLLAGIFLF